MQTKIINETKLNFNKMLKIYFKNDQILSITYSFIFVAMLFIMFNVYQTKGPEYQTQLAFDFILTLVAAFGGFLYPISRALIWKIKTIKKYGKDYQELEYHIADINLKIHNQTSNSDLKLDYRQITKVKKMKEGMIIHFGPKIFIFIDNKGFKNINDIDKFISYLHRFIDFK